MASGGDETGSPRERRPGSGDLSDGWPDHPAGGSVVDDVSESESGGLRLMSHWSRKASRR